MIKAICPHCKNNILIVDEVAVYNLNRLGESLYRCDCCSKTFRVFCDGEDIVTTRISKR